MMNVKVNVDDKIPEERERVEGIEEYTPTQLACFIAYFISM